MRLNLTKECQKRHNRSVYEIGRPPARAPWYTTKAQPSTADMAGKLRRVIIAAKFAVSRPDQPTREEINVIRLAWEDLAA
jgi:hypothetical protein